MKPTFCNKCGMKLPDDSVFCSRCGVQVYHPESGDTPEAERSRDEHANGYAAPQPVPCKSLFELVEITIDQLPITASMALKDNEMLVLHFSRVLGSWAEEIPLNTITQLSLSVNGKGLLANKFRAVLGFYANGRKCLYTIDGKGKNFQALVNNVAAYAGVPLQRV